MHFVQVRYFMLLLVLLIIGEIPAGIKVSNDSFPPRPAVVMQIEIVMGYIKQNLNRNLHCWECVQIVSRVLDGCLFLPLLHLLPFGGLAQTYCVVQT